MGENSKIAWCDHTFNPWIGCTKVSPGCANCYAERQNKRYNWNPAGWGDGALRKRTSAANWQLPIKLAKQAVKDGVTRRVFCASLADVFDPLVPYEWVDDLWKLVFDTADIGGLEWLILTKRPERIKDVTPVPWLENAPGYLRIGVTCENQEMSDIRIRELLRNWRGKNFVSYEPALGAVDFAKSVFRPGVWELTGANPLFSKIELRGIDWVICGGESGPGARPMHPDWARSVRDQCWDADVPFFFKQWGEWAEFGSAVNDEVDCIKTQSHQFEDGTLMFRVGKNIAGNLLDGRQWLRFPEVAQ